MVKKVVEQAPRYKQELGIETGNQEKLVIKTEVRNASTKGGCSRIPSPIKTRGSILQKVQFLQLAKYEILIHP